MKVGQQAYTELSIQIATLEAKVDKILQLLMKPEITIECTPIYGKAPPVRQWSGNDNIAYCSGSSGGDNSSHHTDLSDDEIFLDENK